MVSFNPGQEYVSKKYAQKKIVKGPDGKPQVILVDSNTGKIINNPKGYTIIESSNVIDPAQQQRKNTVNNTNVSTTKGQTLQDDGSEILQEVRGIPESSRENPNITAAKQTGERPVNTFGNQYGYTNKPAGMGFLGFLPQPLGFMATGANLGINAKNTEAVNDQREVLGFSDRTTMQDVGSTLFDKQGYIGDQATIDNTGVSRTTPVSFEAEDAVGRTTLTPEEARMREELNPQKYDEASQAAIDNAKTKFAQENPSWAASLATSAKGLFSNMFGSNKPASMENTSGVGSGNVNAFPTKPDAPKNTTANVDTGRGPTGVDTSGYSPGLW